MHNPRFLCLATLAILIITLSIVPRALGQYTETTIHNFTGGNDGSVPTSGLIFDAQGNLYGTTSAGGPYGWGTVFRLSPQSGGGWSETVLFAFSSGTDGGYPNAGLVMDSQGNLYGTTISGGNTSCIVQSNPQCGVVFKLSPEAHGRWKETVLHAFQNNARDGFNPFTGLVFDSAGNLYGTTAYGGAYNVGTVFELTPTTSGPWKEKVLHSFTGGADGSYPSGTLISDSTRSLYGTTFGGGIENTSTCTSYGCGVVYKLAPTSTGRWNEHVLYSFSNTGDGESPSAGLTFDAAGNLYGTTAGGGNSSNGTVFELTKGLKGLWIEKVLYDFQGGTDGMYPNSVIFDPAGNLYGTTYWGGGATICAPTGCGTVFELSPNSDGSWAESILYTFTGGADGCRPQAALVEDSVGNFYSTTQENGAGCLSSGDYGAVFELTP